MSRLTLEKSELLKWDVTASEPKTAVFAFKDEKSSKMRGEMRSDAHVAQCRLFLVVVICSLLPCAPPPLLLPCAPPLCSSSFSLAHSGAHRVAEVMQAVPVDQSVAFTDSSVLFFARRLCIKFISSFIFYFNWTCCQHSTHLVQLLLQFMGS